jgi:kumamolisin
MHQRAHQRSEHALSKDYGFVRQALRFDPSAIAAEIQAAELQWIASQWKWHAETRFCVLRGGSQQGYEGSELTSGHSTDHPNLAALGGLRALLDDAFPARVTLAWLGWLPENGKIHLHVDNTRHWDEHHRVHVPLVTNPAARLCVGSRFLHLQLGSAWIVNNSLAHGAVNLGPDRLHLMLDLPGSEAVERWIAEGSSESGEEDTAALAMLARDPLLGLSPEMLRDRERLARMLQQ